MHSKRATWQWRLARVSIAVVLLVALNAGAYFAWAHFFPNNPLFPESKVVEELGPEGPIPVSEAVIAAQQPENATELVDSLLEIAPSPGTDWRVVSEDPENLSVVAETSCKPEPSILPGLQGQTSWGPTAKEGSDSFNTPSPSPSTSDSYSLESRGRLGDMSYNRVLSGVAQQVRIYPAGTGAVAFDELRERLGNCYYGDEWSLSYWTPLSLGQESLYASFSSEEGTQELVVFRFGDILGVIADRNYGMTQTMASQWALRWAPIIQGLCRDTGSTLDDASRQPLLQAIYRPYSDKRPIRLSEDDKFVIQQEEDALARQRALDAIAPDGQETPSAVYDLPETYTSPASQPMRQPGNEVELKQAPASSYGLTVVIPDEPSEPALPVFPEIVREVRNVEGPLPDKFGPGCGWELLGQVRPVFDEEASRSAWEKATASVKEELATDYRRWIRETWDYAISYKKYLRDAQVWNAWATLAALRVAEVDWRHYDSLLEQYEAEVTDYQDKLSVVLECEAELEEAIRDREEQETLPPQPGQPSPAPSPSLPPLPECDQRPEKPIPPTPPTIDRPPNMIG